MKPTDEQYHNVIIELCRHLQDYVDMREVYQEEVDHPACKALLEARQLMRQANAKKPELKTNIDVPVKHLVM